MKLPLKREDGPTSPLEHSTHSYGKKNSIIPLREGVGTLNCEVSQHLSEKGGITSNYTSEVGKIIHFLKALRIFFLKVSIFMSVGLMDLILSALMSQSCRDTPVFTKNVSPPTSMGLYVSNLAHGVLNGVELELVHNFFYSLLLNRDIIDKSVTC